MAALPVGKSAPQQKWESARLGVLADHPGPWDELIAQANQVSSGNPIGMVNQWVNWHVLYRADSEGDEWASAPTTLTRGFGDCEDFALAKLALLLALGIPSDEMYLVVLRDHRLDPHAVLVVNRDGRFYVLDNRTDMVLTADEIDDYTPIVSFSGAFAWTYGKLTG
jgi:predicted transglutaminase-like cysteine proteinase